MIVKVRKKSILKKKKAKLSANVYANRNNVFLKSSLWTTIRPRSYQSMFDSTLTEVMNFLPSEIDSNRKKVNEL